MAGLYLRGATPVKRTGGAKQFQERDASTVWSDGGAIDKRVDLLQSQLTQALDAFKQSLNGYAGEQALEAVTEYVSAGEFSIVMLGHEPHVAFRVYDEGETGLMSYASLEELMAAAKEEAEEDKDDEMLGALRRIGSLIGPDVSLPEMPVPAQPVRRGRVQARVQ